ncbi:dolichol-phosphate mannosyltransferase [Brevinema andersonii]|uniref:Dolichol-phosphate mannosyltransferase n=1 Tax=Brevinema andersonii TaxID=34097 RepID=A0A1I1E7S9_BREAD|nr:glycosyltransferase family 2 protein [Brevinema andersonii]SFB83127.1 dolichol-phosphate mannosyltransferase [Brevinema andersonii]
MKKHVPNHSFFELFPKRSESLLLIPTWNEGERIQNELKTLKQHNVNTQVDIILMDGGTTDGSIDKEFLQNMGVRGVITILEKGQGRAYRTGFAKAVEDNYLYVVTIDGNNKDNVEIVPQFVQKLKEGFHFVQGSRFMKGGYHKNTPLARLLAIKFFSNPLLSLVSGVKYTETMSAFRGFSIEILKDTRLDLFRDCFVTWEIQWYIASRVPKLGYKVTEIPQSRIYPKYGPTPTKINWNGNFHIIIQLLKVAFGCYNPK